jgi:ribosomal protein L37AE/L43A
MSFQKIGQEEEYIARKEAERRKKLEEEKKKAEVVERKKKHYMHCPKCGSDLKEIDHQGIKIDECQECKGVWLDAGELEEIAKLEKTTLKGFFGFFTG